MSLAGNRYFLLIINNATRKEWIIPVPTKSEATTELRIWKLGVERKTENIIKAAQSDNAPELLKAIKG